MQESAWLISDRNEIAACIDTLPRVMENNFHFGFRFNVYLVLFIKLSLGPTLRSPCLYVFLKVPSIFQSDLTAGPISNVNEVRQ